MSSQQISLYDLLNVAIATPQKCAVNYGALHSLLLAVLEQLDIRDAKTRWTRSSPGNGAFAHLVDGAERPRAEGEQDARPEDDPQERTLSSPSPTPTYGSGGKGLVSRIQACEDGLSEIMKLTEELRTQKDTVRDEMMERQKKLLGAREDMGPVVEKCCHRVDALEEAVTSLEEVVGKYPDPERLGRCVTWDAMQEALLEQTESLHEELVNIRAAGQVSAVGRPNTPLSRNVSDANSSEQPVTSASPTSGGISTPRNAKETREPSLVPSSPWHIGLDTDKAAAAAAGTPLPLESLGAARTSEATENQRSIRKLQEDYEKLEAGLAALREEKVDHAELAHHRGLVANPGSKDASDQVTQQKASLDRVISDCEKTTELVTDVQKAILNLQAEWAKLQEATRCLDEENRQKQGHIEELYRITEELEGKKADKQMVESEIKADKSALESKVSRLQFDSATEQLSAMFHDLLNKVMGQEQDWNEVIGKLSTRMECKLNRIELDSVKKQLEDRWGSIHEKLQAQKPPDHEDAAGLRKQLLERFHCLSCDRPILKHTPGPHLMTLPSTPAFPSRKSTRPYTVYALDQVRQQYGGRSERIAELTDYSHLAVPRSCGGSHTVTSAGQRRSGLQYMKHHIPPESDTVQAEEVDIIGLDGKIYKGRLEPGAIKNVETKLPTISPPCSKDERCKAKDKPRGSPSHKPAVSPDVGSSPTDHQPQSARSAQCSRSVSSVSGRDWPVSALGCASRSSIAQTSAAGGSASELLGDHQVDL